jgi:hypothetical protein
MNVIALTAFIGVALVAFFIAFFVQQTHADSGGEQDALLPLAEENPFTVTKKGDRPPSTPSIRKPL